ncbi:MAG: MBL fold metallo-hydrolase [Syntrophotaleaceae bacterium]
MNPGRQLEQPLSRLPGGDGDCGTNQSFRRDLLRVCLLASGSKGNAIYVESAESRVLVDAGLSARELNRRLSSIGVDGDSLHALLVTHEHADHCRGLGPMARRHKLPVYIHHQSRDVLSGVGRIDDCREFAGGDRLSVRDLRIQTVPLTHDAAATVGYIIESHEGKIGIVTDLGVATRLVVERFRGCRALVLESNHDEDMLWEGPYPWPLKQRIRGNHGHLSNRAAASLLQDLLWEGMEAVFLAHLSETNNLPCLAERQALEVLEGQNLCCPRLLIGNQSQVSACFIA